MCSVYSDSWINNIFLIFNIYFIFSISHLRLDFNKRDVQWSQILTFESLNQCDLMSKTFDFSNMDYVWSNCYILKHQRFTPSDNKYIGRLEKKVLWSVHFFFFFLFNAQTYIIFSTSWPISLYYANHFQFLLKPGFIKTLQMTSQAHVYKKKCVFF